MAKVGRKPRLAAPENFDYTQLDGRLANALRGMVARIKQSVENERLAAIAVGKELIAARELLKNNDALFLPWLRQECGVQQRTAYRYIAAAQMFGKHAENASRSPAQVIYGLSQAKRLTHKAAKLAETIKKGGVVSLAEYRKAMGMQTTRPATQSSDRENVVSEFIDRGTNGDKPGTGIKVWWDNRPTPETLVRYVNERTFANWAKEVLEHFQVKPAARSVKRRKAA